MAEFAHNTNIHSATGATPFYLLHGYETQRPSDLLRDQKVPTAEERIKAIQQGRREAQAAMQISEERTRYQHDGWQRTKHQFNPGDQVWIDATNLRVQTPSKKPAPKRYGPFKIIKEVGQGSYQVQIPETWRIHPVFHASLILPYKETSIHGSNYTQPPPDVIGDVPEWEVEEIGGIRKWRNQWQYFIKWKGYPPSDNTWEPLSNVQNAMEIIRRWHKKNPNKPKPQQVK